ncbi:MAG TPA: hypothetical protein PLU95_02115 [Syntrophales bacterium]|jgi:hypothetical protein|nr:hypothetical protein [Syntrophales bacterium]HOD97884.1 hypothetical protein [Syntrophales bacterium]HOH72850.1 hypothetical protein [Syntrophales bacterium]HPN08073.1 hypothetical protein [Syntrophales bacterium]HPX80903.1 hypothetical protein [Syntrophales bacterium]
MNKRPLSIRGLLIALALFVMTGAAFAADSLRISPVRIECGLIEEGTPATMVAVVENISGKEVRITGIRTN